MTTTETDILVIGAGPAGSSAAIEARLAGARVIVVERTQHVGDEARGVGFAPKLFASGLPIPRILLCEPIAGTRIHLEGEVHERNWPGVTIPVRNLFRVLAGTASDLGADYRSGLEINAITPNAEALFTSPTDRLEVRAKVAIACDGTHSKTARLLDMGRQPHLQVYQCEALLLEESDWIELHIDRRLFGGCAWVYPRRTTASIGVAVAERAHAEAPMLLEWFREMLVEKGVIAPQSINRTSGPIPSGGLRPSVRVGQVLLAGDAAGTAHPMGVAGIHPAMESGRMAGRAAAAFVRGDLDALQGYEKSLRGWLSGIFSRALSRRQFLESAWDRTDFRSLVLDTCLG